MGLTERHWFEDEEPELTENQLEDILLERDKAYKKGYEKGYHDGYYMLDKQNSIKPKKIKGAIICNCGRCKHIISPGTNYCPACGFAIDWE